VKEYHLYYKDKSQGWFSWPEIEIILDLAKNKGERDKYLVFNKLGKEIFLEE